MKARMPVLIAAAMVLSQAHATQFSQTNLVTDDQSVNAAQITDAGLRNAWGVSYSPTSPFWVSNNAAGTTTIYAVNPVTNATTKIGLTVSIPGNGTVTGQTFAGLAGNFNGDAFLFTSEDGTISGWRGALGTNAETLQVASTPVYKGTAFANIGGNGYLYAANFHDGTVDVLKGNPGAPALAGNFTDPALPAGYAPFNIANLGGSLYVTYAQQDGAQHDEVAGPGLGIVDEFGLDGSFVKRVATGGTLNAPWGLAIAPSSFAEFAGKLLVGNFGDGHITAIDPSNGNVLGQLAGTGGQALAIDGLWALVVGNGGSAGSTRALYFSAGPQDETHGLFGVLAPVPVPAALPLLLSGLVACGARMRLRC